MPPDDFPGPPGYDGESAESEAADSPGTEPEAPYGYRVDGAPRKSAAGRRPSGGAKPQASGAAKRRAARERAAGSGQTGAPPPPPRPRATSSGGSRTRKNTARDYAEGFNGLGQLVGGGLWTLGQMTGQVAWQLDAAAILYHGPPLCDGLGQVAAADPRLAAIADRLLTAGPYAAALLPGFAFAAQLGVNHRALPDQLGALFGALPPEVLLSRIAAHYGGTTAAPAPPGEHVDQAAAAAAAA